MTNQRINDVDTITTFSGTDRLLVNTDVLNNVLEQIEKDDFVADIVSTDSGNLLDVGADNKLAVIDSTITLQGNTFNGNSQLIQTTSAGLYPALDGSLITGVSATIDKTVIQLGTCSTASATAEKAVDLSGFVLTTGATIRVTFTNANTATTPTLNVNSTGAINIVNTYGETLKYIPDGIKLPFLYDGTNYIGLYNSKGIPDLTAGVSRSTGSYTPSKNGIIIVDVNGASSEGIVVDTATSLRLARLQAGSQFFPTTLFCTVKRGREYTITKTGSNVTVVFYPFLEEA